MALSIQTSQPNVKLSTVSNDGGDAEDQEPKQLLIPAEYTAQSSNPKQYRSEDATSALLEGSEAWNKQKKKKKKKKKKRKGDWVKDVTLEFAPYELIIVKHFTDHHWLAELIHLICLTNIRGKDEQFAKDEMEPYFIKHQQFTESILTVLQLFQTYRGWKDVLLLYSIQQNNKEAVESLLAENKLLVNSVDSHNWIPLLHAIRSSNNEIAMMLIEHDADIHFKDRRGCNALWYAVQNENDYLICVLMEHGAKTPDIVQPESMELAPESVGLDLRQRLKKEMDFFSPHQPEKAISKPIISRGNTEQIVKELENNLETNTSDGLGRQRQTLINEHMKTETNVEVTLPSCAKFLDYEQIFNAATFNREASDGIIAQFDACFVSMEEEDLLENGDEDIVAEITFRVLKMLSTVISEHAMADAAILQDSVERTTSCSSTTSRSGENSSSNTRSTTFPSSSNLSSSQQGTSKRSQKRRRINGNDEDEDGQDDQNFNTSSGRFSSGVKKLPHFACPFNKKFPEMFDKTHSPQCLRGRDIHRLKEHLYRRHALPPHCPRCLAEFESTEDLESHSRQPEPCSLEEKSLDRSKGFNQKQKEAIQRRKKEKKGETDEEIWNRIYHVLFPETDKDSIPSPYVEVTTEQYEPYYRQELIKRVSECTIELLKERHPDLIESLTLMMPDIVLKCQQAILWEKPTPPPAFQVPVDSRTSETEAITQSAYWQTEDPLPMTASPPSPEAMVQSLNWMAEDPLQMTESLLSPEPITQSLEWLEEDYLPNLWT